MRKVKKTTLIITDIHADISSLISIFDCVSSVEFKERFGSVQRVLNLGDVVGRGYHPNKVIEFIKDIDIEVISLMGNHDEAIMYNRQVTGDDPVATKAHKEFKERKEHWDYFEDLKDKYVDTEKQLLCVHGGPIDPGSIAPMGLSEDETWLYQRTWQRLDPDKSYYDPFSGFHYTPKMAFEHGLGTLNAELDREAKEIIIFAGHQHEKAIFRKKGDMILDILPTVKNTCRSIACSGQKIGVSELELEDDSSYYVRFGVAGPQGFRYVRSQFGLLYRDKNTGKAKTAMMELDRYSSKYSSKI